MYSFFMQVFSHLWPGREQSDPTNHSFRKNALPPLGCHFLCCAGILVSFLCVTALAILLIVEINRAAFASRVADQVLRFHVIANSDREEDQLLKLAVRDGLISYMADHRESFDSASEAAAFTSSHCEELCRLAQDIVDRSGLNYEVRASVTTVPFPEKTYGQLTFPAGDYQALRIEIGQAQGQNWWCVLYPLLCFTEEGMVSVPEESQDVLRDTLSEEDYRRLLEDHEGSLPSAASIKKQPQIRLRLWDWLVELFTSADPASPGALHH